MHFSVRISNSHMILFVNTHLKICWWHYVTAYKRQYNHTVGSCTKFLTVKNRSPDKESICLILWSEKLELAIYPIVHCLQVFQIQGVQISCKNLLYNTKTSVELPYSDKKFWLQKQSPFLYQCSSLSRGNSFFRVTFSLSKSLSQIS